MDFYKHILVLSIIFLDNLKYISTIMNHELKIVRSGLDTVYLHSIGLKFYVDLNNTSENQDFSVELNPDQCCLKAGSKFECDALILATGCADTIMRHKRKTLNFIVPLLEPFERKGYCTAFIDSKSDIKPHTMRNAVKIHFNTRLANKKQSMEVPDEIRPCNQDQDPLNDCKPVDCLTYYNGRKPFFSKRLRRCVDVPQCVSRSDAELPNVVYDPVANQCLNDDDLIKDDMEYVKKLTHGQSRNAKDLIIIKNRKAAADGKTEEGKRNENANKEKPERKPGKKPCKKPKENTSNTPVALPIYNEVKPKPKSEPRPKKIKCKVCQTKLRILGHCFAITGCTMIVVAFILCIQCCLICAMIYFLTRNCCCNRKKIVRRFYNYRQDASVTTPLIGTSNIDTDTTDYQYVSESSNIDKKIKCYKAIQKEKHNTKLCLSDDILSKCLNRRNWNSKLSKSEAPDVYKRDEKLKMPDFKTMRKEDPNFDTFHAVGVRKQSEAKVNFENEKLQEKKESKIKSVVQKISKASKTKKDRRELNDSDIVLSEQEIKCHSYNYMDSNVSESQSSKENTTGFNPSRSQKLSYVKTDVSKSTGKAAQAYFSKDSLDDYLSERGIVGLAGDDISKYSLSLYSSQTKSSNTSVSSKTSKNNIVKNVMSLLNRRKSKTGPLSDPGTKKSKESLNLEIIHMSNASVFTSSNNESDCLKNFRKIKDSRSSL